MVVTRKRSSVRIGKVSGPTKSDNPSQVKVKGNLDLSQASAHVEARVNLSESNQKDSTNSREETACAVAVQDLQNGSADPTDETTHAVVAQNPLSSLEIKKDCVMDDCLENPYVACQQDMKQTLGNKRKALAKNEGQRK